jgi:DNA-binding response OmpR family regulator
MYILIIEDNPDLVENIYDFFQAHGHIIDAAYTGGSGLLFVEKNNYDAVILDLTLPDSDGLEICSTLREQGFTLPILMLTARDTLDDKLLGFNQGADDYLVKPFSLQELEVRLHALVRRTQGDVSKALLCIADLEFNPITLAVQRQRQAIELPPIPLKILALLMRQSPQIVTRQDIERHIWGENLPETDSLRAHLHTLRLLVDKPFTQPPLLQTIRGIGYRIVVTDKHNVL